MNIEGLQRQIKNQNDCDLFRGNTALDIASYLKSEVEELNLAIELAYLTDDLTEVASEIGDCSYLILRLVDELGLKLEDLVKLKIKRNGEKYKNQSSCSQAKLAWEEKGGDKVFFENI